jgi:hypothetical protein
MFSCIRMAYPSPAAWTKTEFDFLTNPPPKAEDLFFAEKEFHKKACI